MLHFACCGVQTGSCGLASEKCQHSARPHAARRAARGLTSSVIPKHFGRHWYQGRCYYFDMRAQAHWCSSISLATAITCVGTLPSHAQPSSETPPAALAAPSYTPPSPYVQAQPLRTAPGSPALQYAPSAAVPAGLPPPPPGYRYVPVPNSVPPNHRPPDEIPYEDGAPIPMGYRIVEAPRQGLVTAGYIVTGIPYGFSAMTALGADFRNASGYLLLPFIGPWLTLGHRNYGTCQSNESEQELRCVADIFVVMALISDGVMQATGGALLLSGYVATRKKLVRQSRSLELRPGMFGMGYGMTVRGTF